MSAPDNAMHRASGMKLTTLAGLVMLATLNGCASTPADRQEDRFVEIAQLRAQCGLPGKCDQVLACEGKVVGVKGVVDTRNIFDRKRYPALPYEKFSLIDNGAVEGLEVWAVSANNAAIFEKLPPPGSNAPVQAFVKGVAVGVDQPIAGRCLRTIKLEIRSSHDLTLKTAY